MIKLKQSPLYILLLVFLLVFLTGCQGKDGEALAPLSQRVVRVEATVEEMVKSARAFLEPESTTPNFRVFFEKGERVQLVAAQGGRMEKLAPTAVREIGSKGDICHFELQLPTWIRRNESLTLLALLGSAELLTEGEELVFLQYVEDTDELSQVHPPLVFIHKGILPRETLRLKFHHLATYEVVHFSNKSNNSIRVEASLTDDKGESPWKILPSGCNLDLLSNQYRTSLHSVSKTGGPVRLLPGESKHLLRWLLPTPNGSEVSRIKVRASIDGQVLESSNEIETDGLRFERGKAYHLYLTYDGQELYITDKEGNRRSAIPIPSPTPPIPTPTDQEKITVRLDNSYEIAYNIVAAPGRENEVWVDKNGNGKRDSGEEIKKFGLGNTRRNEFVHNSPGHSLTFYGPVTHFAVLANQKLFVYIDRIEGKILRMLDLSGVKNLYGFPLSHSTNLEYLDISGAFKIFTNKEVDFSRHTNLRTLLLRYTPVPSIKLPENGLLEVLDLTGNKNAISLHGQKGLRRLSVSGNPSFIVDELMHTPELEYLDMTSCDLFSPKIRELLKVLPDRRGKTPGHLFIANNPGVGRDIEYTEAKKKNWQVDVEKLVNSTIIYPDMTIEQW